MAQTAPSSSSPLTPPPTPPTQYVGSLNLNRDLANQLESQLPRPRYLVIPAVACLADWGLSFAYLWSLGEWEPGLVTLFVWGLLRPVIVLLVLRSRRIRELSWVVLAQVVVRPLLRSFLLRRAHPPFLQITLLVALYRLNVLVQSRPDSSGPNPWDPSPTTRFLVLSLGFSILHYLLYATFVGIRRRSNPFAGRAGATGLRGSTWGEQRWEGEVESVRGDTEEVGELEEEEESEEDTDSETEDEDEIIDMPKPATLRSRSSRMTLRGEEGRSRSRERRESMSPSERGLRVVTRYGSINSLGESLVWSEVRRELTISESQLGFREPRKALLMALLRRTTLGSEASRGGLRRREKCRSKEEFARHNELFRGSLVYGLSQRLDPRSPVANPLEYSVCRHQKTTFVDAELNVVHREQQTPLLPKILTQRTSADGARVQLAPTGPIRGSSSS